MSDGKTYFKILKTGEGVPEPCPNMPSDCNPTFDVPANSSVICIRPYDTPGRTYTCLIEDCGFCGYDAWAMCPTESCCEDVGLRYWFSGSCHECPEECYDGNWLFCPTSSCCTSNGFFWYDSACHECDILCVAGSLWACVSESCCDQMAGHWFDSFCNDCGTECDEEDFSGCLNEACCEHYGWTWDGSVCSDGPAVCVWEDEFNDETVDTGKWDMSNAWNYEESDGCLNLSGDWASQNVWSKASFVGTGDFEISTFFSFEWLHEMQADAYISLGIQMSSDYYPMSFFWDMFMVGVDEGYITDTSVVMSFVNYQSEYITSGPDPRLDAGVKVTVKRVGEIVKCYINDVLQFQEESWAAAYLDRFGFIFNIYPDMIASYDYFRITSGCPAYFTHGWNNFTNPDRLDEESMTSGCEEAVVWNDIFEEWEIQSGIMGTWDDCDIGLEDDIPVDPDDVEITKVKIEYYGIWSVMLNIFDDSDDEYPIQWQQIESGVEYEFGRSIKLSDLRFTLFQLFDESLEFIDECTFYVTGIWFYVD